MLKFDKKINFIKTKLIFLRSEECRRAEKDRNFLEPNFH